MSMDIEESKGAMESYRVCLKMVTLPKFFKDE